MVCRPLSRTCSPAAEKITETLQAFLSLPRVGAVSPSASGLPFLATRLGLSPQTHWWGLLAFLLLRIRQLVDLLDAPVCPLTELAHLLELFPTSCSAGLCGCNIRWMLRSTTSRRSWIFSNCVVGGGMLGLIHEAGGTIGRNLEEPTASCAAPSSVAVRGGDRNLKWLVSVTRPCMNSAHVA